MSEEIVVALIGFCGAILGAAIVGFATFESSRIKSKGENHNSISCGLVGSLASIGAAVGLIIGAFFGLLLVNKTSILSQPTIPIPTQSISIPTSSSSYEKSGNLTTCSSFQNGETRNVSNGTFIIGDIIIDGIAQYDSEETGEGTVAYFERESTVTAQWGAGCYLGSKNLIDVIMEGEFQHGCGSKCTSIRFVVVRIDGQQQVQYYNK